MVEWGRIWTLCNVYCIQVLLTEVAVLSSFIFSTVTCPHFYKVHCHLPNSLLSHCHAASSFVALALFYGTLNLIMHYYALHDICCFFSLHMSSQFALLHLFILPMHSAILSAVCLPSTRLCINSHMPSFVDAPAKVCTYCGHTFEVIGRPRSARAAPPRLRARPLGGCFPKWVYMIYLIVNMPNKRFVWESVHWNAHCNWIHIHHYYLQNEIFDFCGYNTMAWDE